jgi:anaerobic selenocysteine-containing dehydrogenase
MCHGVCQVLVHLEGDKVVKVSGDPESPTSRGYICPKGAASPELLYHPDRILQPMRRAGKRGENKWEKITWDDALDEMASRLDAIRRDHGPEYVGMMQGTGRPYTGFNQRFLNAFGSPNFTGVAHICYIPRFLASKITFGPLPICDVYGFGGEKPRCVLIWGCNITHIGASDGMCGGMVASALNKAEKVIVVDPRRTAPAAKASYWLQLRPGSEGALALAMINIIVKEDLVDHDFVDNYTVGFKELAEHVKGFTLEWAEGITRVKAADIYGAARTYATVKPACLLWGNGVDMSRCNFQTARSLLILRAITGNIDCPGGDAIWVHPAGVRMKSPFADHHFEGDIFLPLARMRRALDRKRNHSKKNSQLVQNALFFLLDVVKKPFLPVLGKFMAGSPFARQYMMMNSIRKARFPLCPIVHPPTFWKSIVEDDPYRLKALWIMGSNPFMTMSNPLQIEKALKLLDYIVVSDMFLTPTAQYADLFLPASTWLERDDVVNMHKLWCVTAQRKVAQVGDTKDDREVIIQLAKRLGLTETFPWKDYHDFLGWMLEKTGFDFDSFCEKGILQGDMHYYKYREDGFDTVSGKFEIYSKSLEKMGVSPLPVYREPALLPNATKELMLEYPLTMISGNRTRYFFHSEFRQIESLRKKLPDPLVEINPSTATALGIQDGDLVWIETPNGRIMMKAKLFDGLAPDVVCAQHAWWFPEDDPPEYGWKKSNINLLFGETEYDPDTGSECLHSARCKVYPVKGTI